MPLVTAKAPQEIEWIDLFALMKTSEYTEAQVASAYADIVVNAVGRAVGTSTVTGSASGITPGGGIAPVTGAGVI